MAAEDRVDGRSGAGYRSVTEGHPDTLRISPGLTNVYMNTPPGTLDTWPAYQGRMTLVMEFRDGSDGRLLVRVVDRETGALGLLQAPNTVINSTDFQSAVRSWARAVSRLLDTTNSQPFATTGAAGSTVTR